MSQIMPVMNHYKQRFIDYIQNLDINSRFKDTITNENFIDNNPPFYLYYPGLFSIPNVLNSNDLDTLGIAGYLYYQSTLYIDALLDDKDSSGLAIALICQEEAIKILTSIFGLKSTYWDLWKKRRNEHLKAVEIEKSYKKSKQNFTITQYEELADFKSAFGKAAIDCVYALESKHYSPYYKNLLESHKYFSIAFQINDDILDFKEDYKSGQFNWAVQCAISNIQDKTIDIDKSKKLFYIEGGIKSLFQDGVKYLDKALKKVEGIDVPYWKSEIIILRNKLENSIIEIDNYLEILNAEISHSTLYIEKNNLNNCIGKAIKFIYSKQKKDGQWRDYINQGGISNVWTTAFVTSILSDSEQLKSYFSKNLKSALGFLDKNRIYKLWGYNQTWIEDADSTNMVLLSMLLNSTNIDKTMLNNWHEFKIANSGFSTYKDETYLLKSLNDKAISNVKGWTSVHQCVSAVSFYFLTRSRLFPETAKELEKYFEELLAENKINAYWWTSEVYTYYFLAKSFFELNIMEIVKVIQKKIKAILNQSGTIEDYYGENLFFTGMALEVLLLSVDECKDEVEKIKDYLLNKQFEDGSWKDSNALQIPNPSDIGMASQHYPISTYGTSIRAKEFNRLFTTVIILKSLSEYDQRITCT